MLNKTTIAIIFSLLPLLTNNSALANPRVISSQPVRVNTPLPLSPKADEVKKFIGHNPVPRFGDMNKIISQIRVEDQYKLPPIDSINTQPVHVNTPPPLPPTADEIKKFIEHNPLPQLGDMNKIINQITPIEPIKFPPIDSGITQPNHNYVPPVFEYTQPFHDLNPPIDTIKNKPSSSSNTQSTTSQPINNDIDFSTDIFKDSFCSKGKLKVVKNKIVCDLLKVNP